MISKYNTPYIKYANAPINMDITNSDIEYVVIFQKFKLPSIYAKIVSTSEKMMILRL